MKLLSTETLNRNIMCTPAWFSIIRREHPGYLPALSIRIIIPWYKNDWHYDASRRDRKWCRLYPELFIFGPGFVGQRFFFGWVRAHSLGA
jgi:hypothetical protein